MNNEYTMVSREEWQALRDVMVRATQTIGVALAAATEQLGAHPTEPHVRNVRELMSAYADGMGWVESWVEEEEDDDEDDEYLPVEETPPPAVTEDVATRRLITQFIPAVV